MSDEQDKIRRPDLDHDILIIVRADGDVQITAPPTLPGQEVAERVGMAEALIHSEYCQNPTCERATRTGPPADPTHN